MSNFKSVFSLIEEIVSKPEFEGIFKEMVDGKPIEKIDMSSLFKMVNDEIMNNEKINNSFDPKLWKPADKIEYIDFKLPPPGNIKDNGVKFGSYDMSNEKELKNGDAIIGKVSPVKSHKLTGDKLYLQAGQMGIVGISMPFTKDGIEPDIIINPNAIPNDIPYNGSYNLSAASSQMTDSNSKKAEDVYDLIMKDADKVLNQINAGSSPNFVISGPSSKMDSSLWGPKVWEAMYNLAASNNDKPEVEHDDLPPLEDPESEPIDWESYISMYNLAASNNKPNNDKPEVEYDDLPPSLEDPEPDSLGFIKKASHKSSNGKEITLKDVINETESKFQPIENNEKLKELISQNNKLDYLPIVNYNDLNYDNLEYYHALQLENGIILSYPLYKYDANCISNLLIETDFIGINLNSVQKSKKGLGHELILDISEHQNLIDTLQKWEKKYINYVRESHKLTPTSMRNNNNMIKIKFKKIFSLNHNEKHHYQIIKHNVSKNYPKIECYNLTNDIETTEKIMSGVFKTNREIKLILKPYYYLDTISNLYCVGFNLITAEFKYVNQNIKSVINQNSTNISYNNNDDIIIEL